MVDDISSSISSSCINAPLFFILFFFFERMFSPIQNVTNEPDFRGAVCGL